MCPGDAHSCPGSAKGVVGGELRGRWTRAADPARRSRLQLEQLLERIGRQGITIQRFKGLGEMNPEQLWETTLCPDTRRLLRVRIEDRDQTLALFNMLMSKREAERRCAWMEEKGDQVEADV